jgi:hypothetical protein
MNNKIYETEKDSITHVLSDQRYIIVSESISGHCCFEYTIVDTAEGVDSLNNWNKTLCETFEEQDAILICKALNQYNEKNKNI